MTARASDAERSSESGMQSLGDVVLQLRRGGAAPDPSSPEEIERTLLGRPLWPTTRLVAELEAAERFDDPARIQLAREKLELGRLRDRLVDQRPPGCWCFGLGGHSRVHLPPAPGEDEAFALWRVWCACPDGESLRAAAERERARRIAAQRQAAVDRMWGSLPLAFREWTFETLASCSRPHADLSARLRQDWLDSDAWLYLHGPTGRAKTGAAVAALRALADAGRSALFQETSQLLQRLQNAYGSREDLAEELTRRQTLFDIDVLLLDDIGAERHRRSEAVDWATEQLWRVISYRHAENKRTLLTSNMTLDELAEHLGHSRISDRIGERAKPWVLDCSRLPELRLRRGAA